MHQLFFELIRIAIGKQNELSRLPSDGEWQELFALAKKQSVIGICFIALQKLGADADEGFARIGMSEDTYFKWVGVASRIHVTNEIVNQQCVKVQKALQKAGFESCILKGQGVGSFYKLHETDGETDNYLDLSAFRQPGDIDVWVNADCEQVLRFVKQHKKRIDFTWKHASLKTFEDTEVELHWIPSTSNHPLVNQRLKAYYQAKAADEMAHKVSLGNGLEISAPDAEFQCVHEMLHLFDHFLYEGIGMRQLMDLYFAMRCPLAQETKHCIVEQYKDFHVYDFACGVMWAIQHVFGGHDYLLCEPDEKLGRVLLAEIMEGGNFGKYNKENQVKDESFGRRMMRRMRRRVRLIRYSPWDVVLAPIRKVHFVIWKRNMMNRIREN